MYKDAIETLYSTQEEFLAIGLTGRTGAGCSTAAKILKSKIDDLELEYPDRKEWKNNDKYKFNIVKEYITQNNRWVPFDVIEVSSVILAYVLGYDTGDNAPVDNIINYLIKIQGKDLNPNFKIINSEEVLEQIKNLKNICEEARKYTLTKPLKDIVDEKKISDYYEFYMEKMPKYKIIVKDILQNYSCYEIQKSKMQDQNKIKYHLYTYLMQKWGNNIRASGNPYESKLNQKNFFSLSKGIDNLIEIIKIYNKEERKQDKTRVCIDAIRNVNESNYFKSKYRGYYLMSISVDEADRKNRLQNLNAKEQRGIDNVEYSKKYQPEDFFYHQNIAQCFEMADIHIYNEDAGKQKKFFLTWQLVKYVTLMIHPGLITPTHLERCMQLAFNVKYNSGCLSRQVGAVVTGSDYAVKSVGWNDVPKGHVPCNLRDIRVYTRGTEVVSYSEFENDDEMFSEAMKNVNGVLVERKMENQRFPYCFKDVYNGYTDAKNQVFTRALHAEENAFLQISKYGGQGINDGYLFCTASPCELCSKKAYQLGISSIYYIDPYPGIAEKHIIRVGETKNRPQMKLFYGAIGEAYISLYRSFLPYKDELELISGIDVKKAAKEGIEYGRDEPKYSDFEYKKVSFKIKFISREEIESERTVHFEIKSGEFSGIERYLTWTGSAYLGTKIKGDKYKIIEYKDEASPYRYYIDFNEKKKAGDEINYTAHTKVRDEGHIMHEYFSHYIKNPTEKLHLEVEAPIDVIEEVHFKLYADKKMEMPYESKNSGAEVCWRWKDEDAQNIKIHYIEVEYPTLFYTYSLEWIFKDLNENRA